MTEQTAKAQPFKWTDADGRIHTRIKVWDDFLNRWCIPVNQSGSVGSPTMIPIPDPDPIIPVTDLDFAQPVPGPHSPREKLFDRIVDLLRAHPGVSNSVLGTTEHVAEMIIEECEHVFHQERVDHAAAVARYPRGPDNRPVTGAMQFIPGKGWKRPDSFEQ